MSMMYAPYVESHKYIRTHTHTRAQHSDTLEISLVSIFTLVIPQGKIGRDGRVKVAIHSTYK